MKISYLIALLRIPDNPYTCFEYDYPSVDTTTTFHDSCKDDNGYIYKPARPEDPAQVKSCCECLE